MLIIIPVELVDFNSNTQGTKKTKKKQKTKKQHNRTVSTKSSAKTLQILDKSTNLVA
jgi:hypothetical protein